MFKNAPSLLNTRIGQETLYCPLDEMLMLKKQAIREIGKEGLELG